MSNIMVIRNKFKQISKKVKMHVYLSHFKKTFFTLEISEFGNYFILKRKFCDMIIIEILLSVLKYSFS